MSDKDYSVQERLIKMRLESETFKVTLNTGIGTQKSLFLENTVSCLLFESQVEKEKPKLLIGTLFYYCPILPTLNYREN